MAQPHEAAQPTVAFAVTTRSRLKGFRHFPLMFVASRRISRQLGRTPGVVRWASIIAGPREFWTITVWEDRDRMVEFMGSGAHESIMWLFGHWLRSFWLTRWRPTLQEEGGWDGLAMAPPPAGPPPVARTPEQQAALDAALDAFPRLRESVGPDGAATYATAGFTRRRNRSVDGVTALMVRIAVPRRRDAPRLWRDMALLRRALPRHPQVIRRAVGFAEFRRGFALVVLRPADGEDLLDSALIQRLRDRWGDAVWSMRWEAANEFGHWDGLRIRQTRQPHTLDLPPGAADAAAG